MGDRAKSVLVIDDEEILLQIAKDILNEFNFLVTTASSGAEGISLYQKDPGSFDMVLLDLSLPGMSGTQVFEELRKIRNDVRILFSSGAGMSASVPQGEGLSFIAKPFSVMELVNEVEKMTS